MNTDKRDEQKGLSFGETEAEVRSSNDAFGKAVHLTEAIIGAAFRVSNTLGCGFSEKVYENALVIELRSAGHKVDQQPPVEVRYRNEIVGLFQPDLVVDGRVVVELKAALGLEKLHRAQCLNYLRATGIRTGLVINFGQPRVDCQRVCL